MSGPLLAEERLDELQEPEDELGVDDLLASLNRIGAVRGSRARPLAQHLAPAAPVAMTPAGRQLPRLHVHGDQLFLAGMPLRGAKTGLGALRALCVAGSINCESNAAARACQQALSRIWGQNGWDPKTRPKIRDHTHVGWAAEPLFRVVAPAGYYRPKRRDVAEVAVMNGTDRRRDAWDVTTWGHQESRNHDS